MTGVASPTVVVCGCSTSSSRSAARSATAPGRAAVRRDAVELADAARSARLRALRVARAVARPALRRMRGKAARVRSGARAAIVYDARARALVRAWKEHGRRRLAREAADARRGGRSGARRRTASCPVPGDPERAWHRGDVPPRALATELGRIWALPARSTCSSASGRLDSAGSRSTSGAATSAGASHARGGRPA